MKDIYDFIVWIWSVIQTIAQYAYDAAAACINFVVSLYNFAYLYMSSDPNFQTVPHLGKVMLSSIFAAIIPLIAISILRAILPLIIKGHLEDGLGSLYTGSSVSSNKSSSQPFVRFDDPTVQIAKLSKGGTGQWSAKIVQGQKTMNLFLGRGSSGNINYINAFGSQGTVEWGDR